MVGLSGGGGFLRVVLAAGEKDNEGGDESGYEWTFECGKHCSMVSV